MKVKLRDLTKEQYDKWSDKNCKNGACITCPFIHVNCGTAPSMSWIYDKETFSDKFLDQEIEIEDEPLLTNEEKEYLENVLRPFKDKVISITKNQHCLGKTEYIIIRIDAEEPIKLPMFEKSKYYKTLELGKEYSLEELGLFEDE